MPYLNLIKICKKSSILFFALLIYLSNYQYIFSQTEHQKPLYRWYDETVGKNNLDINNGVLYLNYYKTINQTHCFFKEEVFSKGTVFYENQMYDDVFINFDVHRDQLMLKPSGVNDRRSVILIKDKIKFFIFEDKKFMNLSFAPSKIPAFISGYYEENLVYEKFIFYIKQFKEKREMTSEGKIYDTFNSKNEFILFYKNEYVKVNSKKNIIELFEEYKSQINDFYLLNNKMETMNKTKFMESLFKYLKTISK